MLRAHIICATLLALAASSCVSSAKLNMDHICGLVIDGLMIASNDACDTYYTCSGGKATIQSCSTGNFFDKDSQACMPQAQVNCLVPSAVPCEGTAIGTFTAVAGSCSGYYYCGADGAIRGNCPLGENFSAANKSCVWADTYPCTESSSSPSADSDSSSEDISITITLPIQLCNFIPNNKFFGSPSNCAGWNKCVNNVMISGVCSPGYNYTAYNGGCAQNYVACPQLVNDPYLTPMTCTNKNETKSGDTCSSYYVCDGSNYQLVECPTSKYYDTVSQTCVDRMDARNDCDRCEGVQLSFVNSYSSQNCTGYLYCENGVMQSSGVCPTDSYFDEAHGACVVGIADPTYGCCNPNVYSTSTTNVTTNDSTANDSTTASGNSTTTDSTTASGNSTTTDLTTASGNSTTTDSTTTTTTI